MLRPEAFLYLELRWMLWTLASIFLASIPSTAARDSSDFKDFRAKMSLPGGWIEKTSNSTGKTYYYNTATQESQWEFPTESIEK